MDFYKHSKPKGFFSEKKEMESSKDIWILELGLRKFDKEVLQSETDYKVK